MTQNSLDTTHQNASEQIVNTEQSALAFLRKLCWDNYRRFCIKCQAKKLYRLAGKRYRCSRCGYTFHDFSGRWINKCRIPAHQWLKVVGQFEQGVTPRKIARQVGLSYPTTLKSIEVIRLAIIANSSDAGTLLEHVYFDPPKAATQRTFKNGLTVFGLVEEKGKVRVVLLVDFSPATILSLEPKMLRKSSICYTDEYQRYAALILHDSNGALGGEYKDRRVPSYKVDWDSEFWPYARSQLTRHRGISATKLPQYLKELEFRFNHRDQSIFALLCRYLVSIIPERKPT